MDVSAWGESWFEARVEGLLQVWSVVWVTYPHPPGEHHLTGRPVQATLKISILPGLPVPRNLTVSLTGSWGRQFTGGGGRGRLQKHKRGMFRVGAVFRRSVCCGRRRRPPSRQTGGEWRVAGGRLARHRSQAWMRLPAEHPGGLDRPRGFHRFFGGKENLPEKNSWM